ncbi:hypothetical protein LNTAR_14592 [Lentisphaera araneosa HTCC2155]|uniref:Uncharacterized protein n=1 Tax=Lentisphaera araneosa HTCC2155 TaxID=313628 RepID=A6DHH0_9BACT|nr:hypothetical protein [Lentisphaera araneosa]EDM29053.1 hypothetical protein LNTAR_14592 [Lentisphaera araneosa HTCC2155]
MKIFFYILISFSIILNAQEKKAKKKGNEFNQHNVEILSLKLLEKKYVPKAKKELSNLEKEKKRYEAGLAKLSKNSKSYKARKAEYDTILKNIKAQKIIIVYTTTFKKHLEEKLNKNYKNVDKHEEILAKLKDAYQTETGERFPNLESESLNHLIKKK